MISVRDAGRWMAAMAAAYGLVSPNERRLMKVFAERFSLDTAYLFRMAHAIANEVPVPEVETIDYAVKKGRMFEDFVVKLTADGLLAAEAAASKREFCRACSAAGVRP